MIVTENFKVGERDFIRTYSNSRRYVVRDGASYSEACDPAEFGRTYTEGDLRSSRVWQNIHRGRSSAVRRA